ncbi:hypothetical protein [Hoeflea sp.]|uniref:hypothetical protein n=1 Tax=Hoeflea sp. TaxID=1940281 RepID=UPI003B026244
MLFSNRQSAWWRSHEAAKTNRTACDSQFFGWPFVAWHKDAETDRLEPHARRPARGHVGATPSPVVAGILSALLCSTALVMPGQVLADEFLIDQAFLLGDIVTNDTNGGLTGVGDGDTVKLGEGISVVTDEAAGFEFFGVDSLTFVNNGTIFTSGTLTDASTVYDSSNGRGYGDGFYGWRVNNLSFTNNGVISIGDAGTYGALITRSENVSLTNNGTIRIREEAAVDNYDPGNGNIATSGAAMGGFRINAFNVLEDSSGAFIGLEARGNNRLINNGLIESFVLQSRGMYIDGAYFDDDPSGITVDRWVSVDSTMINNGRIFMGSTSDETSGTFDASGMRIEGHDGTIINHGNIHVVPRGFGIDYNGAGGTIINTGTIILDGEYSNISHGIEHYRNLTVRKEDDVTTESYVGERSYTANYGSIFVYGNDTHGVSLNANQNHNFINAGKIFAMNGYSIDIGVSDGHTTSDGENNIKLLDGSVLYGLVGIKLAQETLRSSGITEQLGSTHLTNIYLGDGLNATIRFDIETDTSIGTDPGTGGIVDKEIGSGLPDLDSQITSAHNNHYIDRDKGIIYVADLDSYAQQDQTLWRMSSMLQDAIDSGSSTRLPANTFGFSKGTNGNWAQAFGGGLFAQRDGAAPAYNGGSAGIVAGLDAQPLGFHGGLAVSYVAGDEQVSYETTSTSAFAGVSGNLAERLNYSFTAGAAFNSTDRDQADNMVVGGIDSDTASYASVFWSPSVRLEGPIKGSSVRLLYTGLWQQGHTFSFPGGTILSVDSRFANFVQSRFQMEHKLAMANIAYGVEASWTDGQDMSFSLMGAALETPYDDGFYSRFFTRVSNDHGYVEVGYDTEERATAEAGLKLKF